MKTLLEVLRLSTSYLQGRGVEHPRLEAEWLLTDALGLESRLELYLEHDRPLSEDELARCREWLMRRGAGEPLQYIRGFVEFYGCHINVDQRVLIPRSETEWLVDTAVKALTSEDLKGKSLWDLCTGSGCIAIAIKHRFPELKVFGSDISKDALALAAHNATQNGVEVEWRQGDFIGPLKEHAPIDYCICNPPYIAPKELPGLPREVVEHEPQIALQGGDDGLHFYKVLAKELPNYLSPGARVWLETGAFQGTAVTDLFQGSPWLSCTLHKDLAGHDRIVALMKEPLPLT